MPWYLVRKKIKGRTYFYRQRSWREGGKVKTQSIYLGPAGESGADTVNPTTSKSVTTTPSESLVPLQACDPPSAETVDDDEEFEFGKRVINWSRPNDSKAINLTSSISNNPTKPTKLDISPTLAKRKISHVALAR